MNDKVKDDIKVFAMIMLAFWSIVAMALLFK